MSRGVSGRGWAFVVLVVVTAGCSGVGAEVTATETLTPAPVATDEPGAEQVSPAAPLPPGIGADGSIAVGPLLAAHDAALSGTSYTWVLSYTQTNLRTGVSRLDYTKRVSVAGPDRYLVERTSRIEDGVDRTVFVNETGEFTRFAVRNHTSYRHLPNTVTSDGVVEAASLVERTLGATGARLEPVEQRGRTYYQVTARDPPAALAEAHHVRSIRPFDVTAHVTPAGVVSALAARYEFGSADGRVRVTLRYHYSAVGETTVSEPAWTDRVRGPPAW